MAVYLVQLMLVPLIIGVVGMFWSKGRISWQEFLCMEFGLLLILALGYGIASWQSTHDVEVWSGRVAEKHSQRVSCEHAHTVCMGSGKTRSCYTWYEHGYDVSWYVVSTSTDTFQIARVDRQGLTEPPRFTAAYRGEPTSATHSYTNYVKANPASILRRSDALSRVDPSNLPAYPDQIYDYYRLNRFRSVGFNAKDSTEWNWLLDQLNGDLGPTKQLNVIVVLVKSQDPSYEFALEQTWIGGKKNDAVILIGVPDYPKINWVRVMSWTDSTRFKVVLRDDIQGVGTVLKRDDIIAAIRRDSQGLFVRKSMDDFKYLMASSQPGPTTTLILMFLGTLACLGMAWYFWENDPFYTQYDRYSRYGY